MSVVLLVDICIAISVFLEQFLNSCFHNINLTLNLTVLSRFNVEEFVRSEGLELKV